MATACKCQLRRELYCKFLETTIIMTNFLGLICLYFCAHLWASFFQVLLATVHFKENARPKQIKCNKAANYITVHDIQ